MTIAAEEMPTEGTWSYRAWLLLSDDRRESIAQLVYRPRAEWGLGLHTLTQEAGGEIHHVAVLEYQLQFHRVPRYCLVATGDARFWTDLNEAKAAAHQIVAALTADDEGDDPADPLAGWKKRNLATLTHAEVQGLLYRADAAGAGLWGVWGGPDEVCVLEVREGRGEAPRFVRLEGEASTTHSSLEEATAPPVSQDTPPYSDPLIEGDNDSPADPPIPPDRPLPDLRWSPAADLPDDLDATTPTPPGWVQGWWLLTVSIGEEVLWQEVVAEVAVPELEEDRRVHPQTRFCVLATGTPYVVTHKHVALAATERLVWPRLVGRLYRTYRNGVRALDVFGEQIEALREERDGWKRRAEHLEAEGGANLDVAKVLDGDAERLQRGLINVEKWAHVLIEERDSLRDALEGRTQERDDLARDLATAQARVRELQSARQALMDRAELLDEELSRSSVSRRNLITQLASVRVFLDRARAERDALSDNVSQLVQEVADLKRALPPAEVTGG
jgi:hypothetical protein